MKRVVSLIGAAMLCAACVFPINGLNGVTVNNGKKVTCKGPVITKELNLSGFDAITVNGSSDMELFQGESFQLVVKANEEVFDYIDYKVEDGVLILETKDHVNIRAEEYDVTITLPVLKELIVNGAADVDIKKGYAASENLNVQVNGAGDFDLSGIAVPSLSFTLNGAGDIEADGLDVDELSVAVNGAGDIDVSGKAGKASFRVSGAGDIDARGLDCESVTTHKSGMASIRLK
ncbi:MAG: DUF2807 domain-containing protein [Bacteroidales bacterium]|nr:DUF2807 domain-containing protein [Bacteroidales bacterium]